MSIVARNATSLACADELTLLPANLDQDFRQGGVSLVRVTTDFAGTPLNSDSAGGVFEKWTAADILKLHGSMGVSTYGACSVFTFFGQNSSFNEVVQPTGLDAGPQLNLKLPDSSTLVMPQSTTSKGSYAAQFGAGLPPEVLQAGTYTVDNGSGGADVAGFTALLTVPAILTWANMAEVNTVNRGAGQLVTWTGGDQTTPDTVIILGTAVLADASAGAGFYCLARAQRPALHRTCGGVGAAARGQRSSLGPRPDGDCRALLDDQIQGQQPASGAGRVELRLPVHEHEAGGIPVGRAAWTADPGAALAGALFT